MAILLVILLCGDIGIEFNPPKQVAVLTILALSHLPSGLDLLTLPDGQHKLTSSRSGPIGALFCYFFCHLDGKILT